MQVTHRSPDSNHAPVARQVMERLRSICELQGWPVDGQSGDGGPLVLRPWSHTGPEVDARTGILTHTGRHGETQIVVLLFSIRGNIRRRVLDHYLTEITRDAANCGVNVTL